MNDFLPEGYEVPSTPSRYMRLQKGENRFRVLSSAITGYIVWLESGGKEISKTTITPKPGHKEMPKHFWVFVVWNYATKKVEILEVTQKTIQDQISGLIKNEDWGSPKEYDLTVIKKGEKLETKYTVMPSPKKPVDESILEEYMSLSINLPALFENEDPFSTN